MSLGRARKAFQVLIMLIMIIIAAVVMMIVLMVMMILGRARNGPSGPSTVTLQLYHFPCIQRNGPIGKYLKAAPLHLQSSVQVIGTLSCFMLLQSHV